MAVAASIIINMEANISRLVTDMDKVKKSLDRVNKSADSMKKTMGVISFAAIVNLGQQAMRATEGVYDFARSIASAGNDIERMSRTLNMTTDDFQKWSYVAKMADVNIEEFGQGFKFLTRSMSEALQGTGDAAKAFNLLGINLKDATGKTKDQQTVMMETIGALEKYADGVNRDSLMLAIFGRGWMSVKPLVDQGTKAIEENRQEIERLNGILGKDTIRVLSESEDAFKRWETVWKVAKAETFGPLAEMVSSMLERMLALNKAFKEGGIVGAFKDVIAAQEVARIESLGAPPWIKDWVKTYKPPALAKKPEAPGLPGKEFLEMQKKQKEWAEASEKSWDKVVMAVHGYTDYMDVAGTITLDFYEKQLEFSKKAVESWDKVIMSVHGMTEEFMDVPGTITLVEYEKELKKTTQVFDSVVKTMATSFQSGFFDLFKGGINDLSDWWKQFTDNMMESFARAISNMISNYMLLGSITGEKGGWGSKGGGWGGVVGLVGGLLSLQHGGSFWANNETLLRVGERGREFVSVTPEGKMSGERTSAGGNTNIFIQAMDSESFDRWVRTKGAKGVLGLLSDDARQGGIMKDTIRGV